MKDFDTAFIRKYRLNENETEFFIEKMGLLVEHNGMDEKEASALCLMWINSKRRESVPNSRLNR